MMVLSDRSHEEVEIREAMYEIMCRATMFAARRNAKWRISTTSQPVLDRVLADYNNDLEYYERKLDQLIHKEDK